MANIKPLRHISAFTLRVDAEFMAQLDDIRAAERPVLNRSECLRRLVAERHDMLHKAQGKRASK